jgi:hypothetical protein
VQVGKDARACNFLQQLDQDPRVGNSIDATSYYELEQTEYAKKGVQLSPELWLVKMMVRGRAGAGSMGLLLWGSGVEEVLAEGT